MSVRYIKNEEVSKRQAYNNAINAARERNYAESGFWFKCIEHWQQLPTKQEWEAFLEYKSRSRKKKENNS